jgi:ribosome biogenesis protein Tsr3
MDRTGVSRSIDRGDVPRAAHAAAAPGSVIRFDASSSPLWLVANEPLVNDLVGYLEAMRRRIAADPHGAHLFSFRRSQLHDVRAAFARMIRYGEEKLHRCCELLGATYFESPYLMQSVVVGEVETTAERFTLVQPVSRNELYSQTDLDLGTRQLRRLRYHDGQRWSRASLVANFVEYQPHTGNRHGIHKFISRIKAEEQIWNKVVDTIFNLDRLVRADKQLRHLGRFVKDVFGVKAIVNDAAQGRALHASLRHLRWSPAMLEANGVPVLPSTTRLDCIEVKDYMATVGRKATGWEAIKSVFRWWDTMIEVQIQPLENYHREREALTSESHSGFKARREALRNQIADRMPLFAFYRDLLRWLFVCPTEPAPSFESIEIVVED